MSKDLSIPRRNKFGALLPIELTNEEIRNSNGYKEYYEIATGAAPPKPKASVRRTRSSSNTSITRPTAVVGPRLTTSQKGKQATKASKTKSLSALSEVPMTKAQQLKLVTKRSMQQIHISQASGSGADEGTGSIPGVPDVPSDESEEELSWNSTYDEEDDEKDDEEEGVDDEQEYDDEEYDEETRDEERFDPISKTPKNSNDEGNGEEDFGLNVGREEGHNEEEEEDELYRDVNINQGRGLQMTQEVEDSHVTLTSVNPDGMESIFETTSQMDVPTPTSVSPLPMTAPTMTPSTIDTITTTSQALILLTTKIIKEQVKEQVKVQVSKILPRIEQTVNEQLESKVLTRSSHSSKTSYTVVADLSEMKLKKILIEKIEGNKYIQRSDEQRNLYKALVEAYESDKIILDTYGETVMLKRRRDVDADKDEEPSAGPDQGSKRRKEGKEPESASAPTETATRSAGRSSSIQATLEVEDSHVTLTLVNPYCKQQSSSVSSHFVTSMLNPTLDVGMESIFETTSQMDTHTPTSVAPLPMTSPTMTPSTISTITTTSQAPILPTIVLSTIIQNLPCFGLLFGFDNRLRTLEANFSDFMQTNQFAGAVSAIPGIRRREGKEPELASAPMETATRSAGSIQPWISELAKQSDSRSSFNELMDTPLDFFNFLINRHTLTIELLSGPTYERMKGSCKSLVELEYHLEEVFKATTDQLDRVNPEGQQGASSPKYTTSITKTKAADYEHIKWIEDLVPRTMWIEEPIGYDKHALWGRKIIVVTELKVVEWHNYKHLDWITVRRDDDKPYKFKEGDFKRLRIQDIEDMLLILGVESYQKKLNLTKSDSYRSDLKHKEAYTAYSNLRGFNYQNKDKKNRLIRIDELHKFSDGTLTDVHTALDDHLKRIRMQYLPQSIWRKSCTRVTSGCYKVPYDLSYAAPIFQEGVSHWGHKRQQFYGFAVNRESARDVYSKRRIIAATELKIIEWHNYKHLDWITRRRDNDKRYKFKEGNFKRLRVQDIKDMLLLLVQGKLTNLTVKERFTFNVSLRMFTRSIVIQRRVEDLEQGVECYQKKLNLTKPDLYRSDLKRMEAYTTYSNPRGFIYQNKDKKNRLMRIDELHKFSDGKLTNVRTALDDHLKGIRMQYLPQSIWRKSDKDRAAAMIQAIDKRLMTRRIKRSLERNTKLLSGIEDSHHVPSDAMYNPSQPLKVEKTLFQNTRRYTYFYRLSHFELVGIENEIILTKAGNPVKKILLKLNLSDHRKLKDGGKGTWFQQSHKFITTCSYLTIKYKDMIFQDFRYSDADKNFCEASVADDVFCGL
nr:hypothetical protein [Tanacetum cinerariifolium]